MKLIRLACALVVALCVPAVALDVDNPPMGVFADDWYAIMLDGHKSGHMHSVLERRTGNIIRSETTMQMSAGRGNASLTVTLKQSSEESLEGKPLSFSNTMRLGMFPSTTEGRIRDGKVTITTSQFGQRAESVTYDLPEGAKMSWGVYREQIKRGLKPGTSYEISMYEPTMAADRLTPAKIEIGEKELVDLFGRKVEAIRSRQSMTVKALLGQEMAMETVTWLKDDGTPVKLQMSILNFPIEMVACPRSIATAPDDPTDMMTGTLVPVEGRVDASAPSIRYRIAMKKPDGKSALSRLPETTMQRILEKHGDAIVLEVSRRSTQTRPAPTKLTEEDRKLYLAAAPLVNYKDAAVAALVKEAAGDEKDPRRLADRFRRFVGDYIQDKSLNVGFASASEVARSKEGDCTEHGILLAAMGRAVGIPTRVVTGLVYAEHFIGQKNVFVGHLWTQFHLDGEWVDLDAALGQTNVDPTHIAMDVNPAGDTGIADMVGSLWLTMGNLTIATLEAGVPSTRDARGE